MLSYVPIIDEPITGQTGYPRVQLPNHGPGKPDMLSQNAQAQTGYPKVHCKYALYKRDCRSQKQWKAELQSSRLEDKLTQQSEQSQHLRRLGKRQKA